MNWKMYLISYLLVTCSFLPAAYNASAAQPKTITFSGILTTSSGTPVNSAVPMIFSLYAYPSGGAPLWTEGHSSVAVTNGGYSVLLGSVTPINLSFDTTYFLGVTVGSDTEMIPRQELSSFPYAFRALTADHLSKTCSDGEILKYSASVGSWSCSLAVGEPGPQGIQGPIGPAGPAGPVGPQGPAALPGSGLTWTLVSEASQTIAPNSNYIAANEDLVNFMLPASPTVGDSIKIAGLAGNGWKLSQNEGQYISNLPVKAGETWTPRDSLRGWNAVASSSDGSKLVAVDVGPQVTQYSSGGCLGYSNFAGGRIYTSEDAGISWVPRESAREWTSVASSSDGMKLAATAEGDYIYTSADGGVTWTPRGVADLWSSVASSADGNKLIAVAGAVYTSGDSGITWTYRELPPSNTGSISSNVFAASSRDGNKMFAIAGGHIYSSADSGVTWVERSSIAPTGYGWRFLACSGDGNKLVAADAAYDIYISTDSGISWRHSRTNTYPTSALTSSTDGTKLAVVEDRGFNSTSKIFLSSDSGASWTLAYESDSNKFTGIASTRDGSKYVAVATSYSSCVVNETEKTAFFDNSGLGQLLISNASATTHGTGGYVSGDQDASVELFYAGSGQFKVVNSKGALAWN